VPMAHSRYFLSKFTSYMACCATLCRSPYLVGYPVVYNYSLFVMMLFALHLVIHCTKASVSVKKMITSTRAIFFISRSFNFLDF
jgi:hypothetical protein